MRPQGSASVSHSVMHMALKIPLILVAWLFCACGLIQAQPFDRLTTFKTCDEFISALKALQPHKQPSIYSRALSIENFGESQADASIVPDKVESVIELWRNDRYALVFATARPKTEASNAEVAVLIVLSQVNDAWRFGILRRYEAIGKDARITCELTSAGYKATERGHDSPPAVVTFKRDSGGRGASQSMNWSLLFTEGQLYEYK